MANFIDMLETLLYASFKGMKCMPGVLARLCKSAEELCTFLKCKEVKYLLRLKSKVVLESMSISCLEKI